MWWECLERGKTIPLRWHRTGHFLVEPNYTELVRELAHARSALGEAWPEARDTYIQHSDQTIRTITAAVDAGHAAEIVQLAHVLAGGSGMMGAQQLRRLCRDLERAADENKRAVWAALAQNVRDEYARVRVLLQDPTLESRT